MIAGRVLSAELSRLPCKQLSAVWQQSFRGTYDTPFRGAVGVKRQRYVSMEDGRDPGLFCRRGSGRAVCSLWSARGCIGLPGGRWPAGRPAPWGAL